MRTSGQRQWVLGLQGGGVQMRRSTQGGGEEVGKRKPGICRCSSRRLSGTHAQPWAVVCYVSGKSVMTSHLNGNPPRYPRPRRPYVAHPLEGSERVPEALKRLLESCSNHVYPIIRLHRLNVVKVDPLVALPVSSHTEIGARGHVVCALPPRCCRWERLIKWPPFDYTRCKS